LEFLGPNRKFDLVISDVAPNLTPDKLENDIDVSDLNWKTVILCLKVLKMGGRLFMKTFNGKSEPENFSFMSLIFDKFIRYKPDASKSQSNEIYYYGKGFLKND